MATVLLVCLKLFGVAVVHQSSGTKGENILVHYFSELWLYELFFAKNLDIYLLQFRLNY